MTSSLIELSFEQFVKSLQKDNKLLIIASPNYEERSLGLLERFLNEGIKKGEINPENVLFRLFTLHSKHHSVDMLLKLRQQNIDRTAQLLKKLDCCRENIEYPDNFDPAVIKSFINDWINECTSLPVSIIFDMSCMPRKMLLVITEVIDTLRKVPKCGIQEVYAAYTSAVQYPVPKYPQEIGTINGYFRSRPIQDVISKKNISYVVALISPSIQGFEGKLLLDELSNIDGPRFVLVFLRNYDLLTSLTTIRANISLLDSIDVDVEPFFSFSNSFKELEEIGAREIEKCCLNSHALFLTAPFGPKPLVLAAYFLCKEAEKKGALAEIAFISGFQYSSVYSLGKGETTVFKFPSNVCE